MKVENDVTTFSCSKDLLKQNSKDKFIIISSMITTSHSVRITLCEAIYLVQQKNPDRGYVFEQSPGRVGADKLNMYPVYSVKFADFNQAAKEYENSSMVKATPKKHGMNLITAFFEPPKKKAAKVTPN